MVTLGQAQEMLYSRLHDHLTKPSYLPQRHMLQGFLILQVKRLGLEEAPWILAWSHCWSSWQDGPSRTGVWGELPRVREPRGGWRSTGGHQTRAVLLRQEILLGDLVAQGSLGSVAPCAGLAIVGIYSAWH